MIPSIGLILFWGCTGYSVRSPKKKLKKHSLTLGQEPSLQPKCRLTPHGSPPFHFVLCCLPQCFVIPPMQGVSTVFKRQLKKSPFLIENKTKKRYLSSPCLYPPHCQQRCQPLPWMECFIPPKFKCWNPVMVLVGGVFERRLNHEDGVFMNEIQFQFSHSVVSDS